MTDIIVLMRVDHASLWKTIMMLADGRLSNEISTSLQLQNQQYSN